MSGPGDRRPMLAYIDCVRGYAVTLVITCHLAYAFVDLPYPVRRLATMGWHGVQLFFLASALTLLMSWHHDAGRNAGEGKLASFFLRRFFRIAPAYYAAAWLYYGLAPPAGGFDALQLAASYAFVNAWTPSLMPTVPGAWIVVPGGWSIGVEVTFYLVFPLVAASVTSLRRALALFAVCLVAGGFANRLAASLLDGAYPAVAVDNFLYFWFPDQMAVFALGAAVYFAQANLGRARRLAAFLGRHGNAVPALALALFFGCGELGLPHWTGQRAPYLPTLIAAAICCAGFILALAQARRSLWLNPLAAALGRASFSAYLLHFAVIRLLVVGNPGVFHTAATGVPAIAAFAVAWVAVLTVTYAVAWCSYRALELPMIAFGKSLARGGWWPAAQAR